MSRPKQDLLTRVADKFTVGDDCWEWTAFRDRDGYGIMAKSRSEVRSTRAHRIIWELFNPPIPEGLQLDHLCRNRACVRPDHLEVVTCKVNVHRGNTPQAINVAKTHCPKNHEYTPDNTGLNRRRGTEDMSRYCRICHREAWRVWNARRKDRART